MNMALSKQIYMLNVFILLITCNADSTMQINNFSLGHASVEKLVKALSYELTLDLSLKNILVFNVTSTNLIIIEEPTRKIDLNIYELTIRKYTFHLFRLPYMDFYSFKSYYINETRLTLNFDNDVPSGFYNMTVKFSRDIFANEMEVFKTCYKDCNEQARWILKMQLGPNGFLPTFSYWHESLSRARFAIALKHSWNYTVLSNMQIRSQWIAEPHMIQTQFNPTPPVPAHVLALSLTDFDCFIKKVYFFTSRVCSISLVKEQITLALNTSNAVWLYMMFHTFIRQPKFREITHIGLPNYSYKARESWGSNYYREDHLIYNESLHSIDHKLDVSIFVARRTALQWFNYLFNPMLWTHVWFCQTLALFYGAKAIAKTYDENISSLFTYRLRSLTRDDETVWQVGNMMSFHGDNPEEFGKLNIFDNRYISKISLKAYAVMVMIENVLTELVFRHEVISYVEKHQFSTATPHAFWDAMENVIDVIISFRRPPPVTHMVQSWLMMKSLPVVTVRSNVENVVIELEEDVNAEEDNNNTNDLWLPIKYVEQSVYIKRTEWLTEEKKIQIHPYNPDDLIVVNWQNSGYYRVKYGLPLLKRLAAYMAKNHANIDVLNRAQIIEDAYYFWAKYELDSALFEDLTSFMSYEEQCAPWYAIQNIFKKMGTCFNPEIDGCRIKYHLVNLLNQLIEKVGYTEHSNDTECVKFKRLLATKWVCRIDNWECLDNAKKMLMEHLKNPEKHVILPMWEEWTYCNGLKRSDEFTWNKVLAEFQMTGNKKILTYLTCSQNVHIILMYLDLITSNSLSILDLHGLNIEDRRKIYRSIVQKYILNLYVYRNKVMDHIIKKLEEMKNTDVFFFEMLNDVSENVYSMDQAGKILPIIEGNKRSDVHHSSVYNDIFVKFHNKVARMKKL